MSDTLRDIPELFETDLGEAISARTLNLSTYRELGPPDLCHIIKANIKPAIKEVGSYHFVLGVEASNSASLAAYLNSLSYYIDDPQGWFGKNPQWRIRSGVYCCYNSFSRVDVRVEVKIPGGVEAYMVNSKAEKLPVTEEAWAETHLSAALRSISYSDDLNYKVPGMRMLNIVPDLEAENRFLSAAQQLFHKGWQLGTDPTTQFATHVNNHLTDILMKYFNQASHHHAGINFFTKLADRDSEMNSLLSECFLRTDQELQGVQTLCDGLKANPSSFNMLCQQASFLLKKNRLDLALTLAKKAVNAAPSEFRTWITLAEIYISLKDFKAALLTLNSCPMFSYTERDVPRMPPPSRVSFPEKHESILAFGMVEPEMKQEEATTSALFRLPGNSLKGTFASAYTMLTLIASKVGWDDLLRFRSAAFVMEEEYRIQKSKEDHSGTAPTTPQAIPNQPSPNITTFDRSSIDQQNQDSADVPAPNESNPKEDENKVQHEDKDESELQPESKDEPDQNNVATEDTEEKKEEVSQLHTDEDPKEQIEENSTKSPQSDNADAPEEQVVEALAEVSLEDDSSAPVDDIKDSTDEPVSESKADDGFESVAIETDAAVPSDANPNSTEVEQIKEEDIQDLSKDQSQDKPPTPKEEIDQTTNKSELAPPADEIKQPQLADKEKSSPTTEQEPKKQNKVQPLNLNALNANSSQPFGHKRLCERWLDNLFMVLYEDLRAFTAWRAEMSGTRSQRLVYRYTGSEWEALGDLCLRLHRLEEARDAYTNCVHHKFSPRSWAYLLEVHTKENDLQLAVGALIRVAMYFETNYSECMIPSPVTNSFKTLIRHHGLSKIQNLLSSLNLAPEVQKVIFNYLNWCKKFEMEGSQL